MNKSASALISLGQISQSGIEGVFYLQFLIGLDPRGARRLRLLSCAYPQYKNFIVSYENKKTKQHVFAVPFLISFRNLDFSLVMEQKNHTT